MGLTPLNPVRLQEIESDIKEAKSLPKLQRLVEEMHVLLREEVYEIHRKFEWGPGRDTPGGGGGGVQLAPATRRIPAFRINQEVGRANGVDSELGVHKVTFTGRSASDNYREFYTAVDTIQVRGGLGVVWIEELDGGSVGYPRYVRLRLQDGSGVALSDHLIGFDIGFERYDTYVKHMFVHMSMYKKEDTRTDPVELAEQIPIGTGSHYISDDPILTESMHNEYMTTGSGLWLRALITLYA